jgi:hypothetical protein
MQRKHYNIVGPHLFVCKTVYAGIMSTLLSVFVSFSGVGKVKYACDANDQVAVLFERVFADLPPALREQGTQFILR